MITITITIMIIFMFRGAKPGAKRSYPEYCRPRLVA